MWGQDHQFLFFFLNTSVNISFGTEPAIFSLGLFDKATEGGQEVCTHWSGVLHCSGSFLCIIGDAHEAYYSPGHKKWEYFGWPGF